MSELIFEKRSLNNGDHVPSAKPDFNLEQKIPKEFFRSQTADLPELSELEVVRHYTNLSRKNFCVDQNFYPLGSCTMKYNPKVNDLIASWPFYARVHPYQDEAGTQGVLEMIEDLEGQLSEITGMDAFTLQPAAGAQGELAGLLMVRAYHASQKQKRNKILVPDSAHGTNPASAALSGYDVTQVKTDEKGRVDMQDLEAKLDKNTACFMITNPSTLGLFEANIKEICDRVHAKGALMYFDGANLNALLGITRPGDMGFDVVHVNMHKTFAVPHGSGGPGSGPVGVKKILEPFLPLPRLKREKKGLRWDYVRPQSIGRLRSFYGNLGALVRSYCYLRALGKEGVKAVSEHAIINANYLKARLAPYYDVPHTGACMHEFVLSAKKQKERGVTALDIAKRLLDFGIHAPTIYFPMIVEEAMMIEPTETEAKETLDRFVLTMIEIDRESREHPEKVKAAPTRTPVRRINEVLAARRPNLRWISPHETPVATPSVK